MKVEWNGQVGPAFVAGVAQIIALVIGGTLLYANLTNKVDTTADKVTEVRSAVSNLRSDLKTTQTERADQGVRLSRVEEALSFIKLAMTRFEARFDTGGNATAPPKP